MISSDRHSLATMAGDIRRVHARFRFHGCRRPPIRGPQQIHERDREEGPLKIREVDGDCTTEGGIHQLTLLAENVEILVESSET